MHEIPPTTQTLRSLCHDAAKQAQSWHASTGSEGLPARGKRSASSLRAQVAVALVTSIAVASVVLGGPEAPETPMRLPDGTPPEEQVPRESAPLQHATAERAMRDATVRWDGEELVIAFELLPMEEAIRALSRATGASTTGAGLLGAAMPITMRMRTRDVTAAWHDLLQSRASYTLSCSGPSCQVWINGASRDAAPSPNEPREQPAGVSREELESQPDGSC